MPITSLTPNLLVEDVSRSADFWCVQLGLRFAMGVDSAKGFHAERTPGADLVYAQFVADGVEIMVQRRDSLTAELPLFAGKPAGGTLTLYVQTDDLDGLYSRLKESVPTVKAMAVTFYGMREWYVTDPDGYVVCLAQKA